MRNAEAFYVDTSIRLSSYTQLKAYIYLNILLGKRYVNNNIWNLTYERKKSTISTRRKMFFERTVFLLQQNEVDYNNKIYSNDNNAINIKIILEIIAMNDYPKELRYRCETSG